MFKNLKAKIQTQGHEMLQNLELLGQGTGLIDNLVTSVHGQTSTSSNASHTKRKLNVSSSRPRSKSDTSTINSESNSNDESIILLKQRVNLSEKKGSNVDYEFEKNESESYSSHDISNLEASFQEVNLNPNTSLTESVNSLRDSINEGGDKEEVLNKLDHLYRQSEEIDKMYHNAKLDTQFLIQQSEKTALELNQLKESNFNKQSVIQNLSENLEKSEEKSSLLFSEMKAKMANLEVQIKEKVEANFNLSNQIKKLATQLKEKENMIEFEKFNTLKTELVNTHKQEMNKLQERLNKKNIKFEQLIKQVDELNEVIKEQKAQNEEKCKELASLALNRNKDLSTLESKIKESQESQASLEAQLLEAKKEKTDNNNFKIEQLLFDLSKKEEIINELNMKLKQSIQENLNCSNLKSTISSLESKNHSLDLENLKLLQQIQELTDELNQKKNLIDDEQLESLKEKLISEHKAEMGKIEDKINEKEFYIKSLINKKNELDAIINEKDQIIDEKSKKIESLLKEKAKEFKLLKTECDEKQDEIEKLLSELFEVKELSSAREKKIESLNETVKQKDLLIDELSLNLEELNKTEARKTSQIAELSQKIQNFENENNNYQKDLKEKDLIINASLAENLEQLNALKKENSSLKNQIDEFNNQIKFMQLSQAEKDEQIDCLLKLNGLKTLDEDNLDEDLASIQEQLLTLGQRLSKKDSNIENLYCSFHKMFEVMKVKAESIHEDENRHNYLLERISNFELELNKIQKESKSKDDLIESQSLNLKELEKQLKKKEEMSFKLNQSEKDFKQKVDDLEFRLKESFLNFEEQLEKITKEKNEEKEKYKAYYQSFYNLENEKKLKQEEKIVKLEKEVLEKMNEIKMLNNLIEDLNKTIEDQREKIDLATQGLDLFENKTAEIVSLRSECKVKDSLIEKLEEKINYLESIDAEKDSVKSEDKIDKFNCPEDKLIYEYKKEINLLETELGEKNAALEEVHEYYNQKLKEKDQELKVFYKDSTLSSANDHSYQVKAMQKSLLQYQQENTRLKELIEIKNRNLNLSVNASNSASNVPEPTEYEYLKNIIFEYMMGREPLTLAKVISAVLRFTNDQTDQIIKRQESIINVLMPLR